jgi:rod shape-determining protein MreD
MRARTFLLVTTILLLAIVLQTTLFSQTTVFVPDLVMLVVILLALTRLRPETVLGIAFVGGLSVDLLGSSLLGLRAMVFTVVAYVALRTKDRADLGRVVTALWAGLLTFGGVVLLVTVGTLFGQSVLLGDGVIELLLFVPLANMVLAWIFAPLMVRLIDRDATAFRYA